MVLGEVEETVTTIEVDEETYEEIIKTSIGVIYRVNDQLTMHGYFIAEFLGDGEIQQLASINGEKLGEDFEMESDPVIYVFGVSFGYKF